MGGSRAAKKPGTRRRNSGRSKVGCLTCRAKHVKCDERLPICGRCERLGFTCRPHWSKQTPRPRKVTPVIRPLRPRLELPESRINAEDIWVPPTRVPPQDPRERINSLVSEAIINTDGLAAAESGLDESLDASISSVTSHFSYLQVQNSLSEHHIPLPNGLVLNKEEHHAMKHYETTFAITQTGKDPRWSFPSLLLRKVSYSSTTMHFALAISLYDLDMQYDVPTEKRLLAHHHFLSGSSALKFVMSNGSAIDHLERLSCFYYMYIYIARQKVINKFKLNRLSQTVAEYIQSFSLAPCLASLSGSITPTSVGPAMYALICRLLFWVYKEDVHGTFYDCGGDVARYFHGNQGLVRNIWELSQPTLLLNWGVEYPREQCMLDITDSPAVNMMVELLQLGFDVAELCHSQSGSPEISTTIEAKFSIIEVKFATVFDIATSSTKPTPLFVASSAAAVAIFYAWKICYHRYTRSFEEGVDWFLSLLLQAAQRATSSVGTIARFEGFQWALLIAGIETKDPIHREWILSKLTMPRFRVAFCTMMEIETESGGPVDVQMIGGIVSGAYTNPRGHVTNINALTHVGT